MALVLVERNPNFLVKFRSCQEHSYGKLVSTVAGEGYVGQEFIAPQALLENLFEKRDGGAGLENAREIPTR